MIRTTTQSQDLNLTLVKSTFPYLANLCIKAWASLGHSAFYELEIPILGCVCSKAFLMSIPKHADVVNWGAENREPHGCPILR